MDEATTPEFEAACEEFRHVLRTYDSALRANDLRVGEVFLLVETAWQQVVAVAPTVGPKADPSPQMYLVLAFSCAVGAGNATEAERIHGLFSEEERRHLDGLEANDPGKFKIWLHSR